MKPIWMRNQCKKMEILLSITLVLTWFGLMTKKEISSLNYSMPILVTASNNAAFAWRSNIFFR